MLCKTCECEKPEEDFLVRSKSGKRHWKCKTCRTAYNKTKSDYKKKRYEDNKEEILRKMREYFLENQVEIKSRRKEARVRDRDRLRAKAKKRYHNLTEDEKKTQALKKYGLTLEEYNVLFESQNKSCAICETSSPKSKLGFCVDHDHATGKVRGILCHSCNTGIGLLEDNPAIMGKAADYIRNYNNSTNNTTQEEGFS